MTLQRQRDQLTGSRIHIGTDHAGLELSKLLASALTEIGHEVLDHGPTEYDPLDDYPEFCIAAAQAVARDIANGTASLGIVIGGSGNGEQIAANKVPGIRAALVWNEDTARLAREHNDANILAIGSRQHSPDECIRLVQAFVREPFPGETRHRRRISQILDYEAGHLSNRG